MVGRAVSLTVDKEPAQPGDGAFTVAGLAVPTTTGQHVRRRHRPRPCAAGEVLGVAGVQGNGQTELIEAIMGLQPTSPARSRSTASELAGRSARRSSAPGSATCPRTAASTAWSRTFTVAENLVLDLYDRPPFARGLGDEAGRDRRERGQGASSEFDVRTPSADAAVGTLSGGNQQKVIVARELSRPLKLFIAAQPTRGVDVGSIEFIHSADHRRARRSAPPVLIVSSELDEVLRWPTGSR